MNKVNLKFDKKLTNLAGYDFGVKVFEEQAKNKLEFNEKFELVFPDEIRMIASSFVQGFFAGIVKQIGLKATEENLVISNEKLRNSIIKKLQ